MAQMTVTWGSLAFQCAPLEELAVETAYEHANYLTVSSGEYSRPHGANLKTLSFETLVTPDAEMWLGNSGVTTRLAKDLQDACATGNHYLLKAVEGNDVLVEFEATLRSVRVTTKAGEPGTRYLSVAFVEYRSVTFDSVARPVPPTPPGQVTTQKLQIKGGIWIQAPAGWVRTSKPLSINNLATAWFEKQSVGVKAIHKVNPKLPKSNTYKLNNWSKLAKGKVVTIKKGKGATK
jgi:hypothetical protein